MFFNEVAFDLEENLYKEVDPAENGPSLRRISGMEIRRYIAKGQAPPEWMMRPEVSETLLGLAADGGGSDRAMSIPVATGFDQTGR